MVKQGQTVRRYASDAEAHYQAMLAMSPDSVEVLRAYASFLTHALHDHAFGSELLAKADRIESLNARQKRQATNRIVFGQIMTTSDFLSDNAGIITVSADVSRIGEILDVNMAACRMLARPRSELVGHNVKIIVPRPISTIHDALMLRFTRKGTTYVIDTVRSLFAVDSQNCLIPIRINIREAPPSETDPQPRMIALM
jgi:hypothetical protein